MLLRCAPGNLRFGGIVTERQGGGRPRWIQSPKPVRRGRALRRPGLNGPNPASETSRFQRDGNLTPFPLSEIGEGVGVFPEGERSWDGKLQPLRGGTIRVLLTAGVPVIPCGLVGTSEILPRWGHMNWFKLGFGREPVIIRYAEPIHFGPHDDRASRERARADATNRIESALQAVMAR